MNWLAFFASVISSLVWPLLIAGAIFFFYRRGTTLTLLIENVREYFEGIKVGGVELTFRSARAEAEAVAAETGQPINFSLQASDKVIALAKLDPGLAVLEVWKTLEEAIIRLMQHNGLMRFTRPDHFMRELFKQGKLSDADIKLYEYLRNIRNEAVHTRGPQSLTVAEVGEYKSFVDTLMVKLEQIRQEPGYIDIPKPKEGP